MKRDISVIKRIILLVFVLLNVSTAAIILWLLMFIQQYLHPLSYRILCFIIEISMPICSITLLIVSPQLRRALRTSNYDQQQQQQYSNEKKSSAEEMLRHEAESSF
jgi:ABC-type bacteriocin/lantibiotic exporter with double-glycine peptidase domain